MPDAVAQEKSGTFKAWCDISRAQGESDRARDERDLALLEMRDCGYSAPEIGEVFNLTAPYVRTIWQRCGAVKKRAERPQVRRVT